MSRSGNTWFKIKRAKLKKQNQADNRRYAVQVPGPDYPVVQGAHSPRVVVVTAAERPAWNKRAGMFKHETYAKMVYAQVAPRLYRKDASGKFVEIYRAR
jgi:hypothetical protein